MQREITALSYCKQLGWDIPPSHGWEVVMPQPVGL